MQRFDEQFILREAQRKMQAYERHAALHHVLHERRASQPTARQRLANVLFKLAERLEPSKSAVPCEGTS